MLRSKLDAFKFDIDKQHYLLGKILLLQGMQAVGNTNCRLEDLHYTEFNKPYFSNGFHFNISHSGNYVLCVISDHYEVGIDIEEIKSININEFSDCFTQNEWDCIRNSDTILSSFYTYWTRKEAIMKADGRGMHIPLMSFEVFNNPSLVDSNSWYTKELTVADGYVAHLATNKDIRENYSIQQII